jgi:elongation factor P
MATTADISKGMCIELDGDIVKIIDFSKFQVGRGSGKIWCKIKSSTNGKIKEHTFNSGTTLSEVRIERRKFQFLYGDDTTMELMNQESFEQISLERAMVENSEFLKEGEMIDVLYHAQKETILSTEMPQNVILKITYTEPGMKGDTATNTLKSATMETGAEVRVPLFCNEGDLIKIDTETGSYIERVKA